MKYWRKPLDADKVKPSRGWVRVVPDRCKGCNFCIDFCPRHVLQESADFNQKGYRYPHAVRPDDCTGCGLCEMLCPDFAISVHTGPKKKKEAGNV